MSEVIKHTAFVKDVNPESLLVTIESQSECSACNAQGVCNISGYQEKEIEITGFKNSYSVGQKITILFKESSGFKAQLFGYLLPIILLLVTLILSINITGNEGLSGLISISILIPYFITLYFLRHYLKRIFKFEIEETN
jgi:positive regulator of sigma E activity